MHRESWESVEGKRSCISASFKTWMNIASKIHWKKKQEESLRFIVQCSSNIILIQERSIYSFCENGHTMQHLFITTGFISGFKFFQGIIPSAQTETHASTWLKTVNTISLRYSFPVCTISKDTTFDNVINVLQRSITREHAANETLGHDWGRQTERQRDRQSQTPDSTHILSLWSTDSKDFLFLQGIIKCCWLSKQEITYWLLTYFRVN